MTPAEMTQTTTNRTQTARQFLESLIGSLPSDSSLEIRRKRNGEPGTRQQFLTTIGDLDLSSFDPHEHYWFGVCFRKRGASTGKSVDLTYAPVIWLDFDHVDDKSEVINKLLQFKVPPTHIVDSGGGLHAYYRLDGPVDLRDDAQATAVRETVYGLAQELCADPHVHDLARVLRLPGSANVGNGKTKIYSPPREVVVLHCDDGRRVSIEELSQFRRPLTARTTGPIELPGSATPIPMNLLKVTARLKKLIRDGWSTGCGYSSRSELDQAVVVALMRVGHTMEEITAVFQDPANGIGEKYRDKGADGPRYLAVTLAAAKDWIAKVEAESRVLKLEAGTMKTHRAQRNIDEVVYTKPIIPIARLRGTADAWQVRVADEAPRILDSVALSSANHLKRALPPVGAWTGSDQDVQLLIPYFETYVGKIPEKTSVDVIGIHGDRVVFPDAVLGPAGLETDSSLVYTGQYAAASLRLIENWAGLAKAIGNLLFDLHEPGAIHAIAGWFLATFVAPQLRKLMSGGFPLLNVHGATGSGKTTLLSLLWRMSGSTRDAISIQGGTDFTRTRSLSSTNTMPIVLDEHRTGYQHSAFYSTLREGYQAEEHERGRSDLTVVRLPLTSPIAVAGESAFPDPALRQRALIIRLSQEMLGPIEPPSARRQAKAAFEALSLQDFGGGFYQHVRTKDVPAIFREELDRVTRLVPIGTDERKQSGPAVALTGLRLFEDFLTKFDPDEAVKNIARLLTGEEEPSLMRLILLTIFELMQHGKLKIGQDVKMEDGSLFISRPTALHKLSMHLTKADHPLPTSEDALLDALRAEHQVRSGKGIVREMRAGKWLGGTSGKTIELNLEAIETEHGIAKKQWEGIVDAATSVFA